MINVPCSNHIKCHEGILIYYHQKVYYINNVQLSLFAVNKYDLLGSKKFKAGPCQLIVFNSDKTRGPMLFITIPAASCYPTRQSNIISQFLQI
ncbi:hypothetical protein HanXRQr2_Chr15g0706251 [Helianthus annuus]|uniref:Uncharacterized protein n=1 Tax=Helianthus annuus TaxID=4232 RepID=A0A9K3E3X9_HELAN|nr:hypothetical protein HanXRQr2_Chr15g0706251 [Helianthus annuus]KAJ0832358.1 hypothetical protein HanPSC8_Chr15g0677891 [Helianthus annuus]